MKSELRALQAEVSRLNSHRFVRLHNSIFKLMAFNFARGLAFGFGSVVGASVLISLAVWALSTVEFMPIIGEWAAQIASRIQSEINN